MEKIKINSSGGTFVPPDFSFSNREQSMNKNPVFV